MRPRRARRPESADIVTPAPRVVQFVPGHLEVGGQLIPHARLPLLLCLVAFLLTFLLTRTVVRYIRRQAARTGPHRWWQPHNMSTGGVHLHHAVIGVVLVLVSGVTMVTLAVDGGLPAFTVAAVLFGVGAALVLDEFALILHLSDVYWSEDGRTSVDAVFAAIAVAGLLVLGLNPLSFFDVGIWREDTSTAARAAVVVMALGALLLAVVVLLKGKVWTGLIGMFILPLLVVGAVRLSRPHAPWARWRYTTRPRRMHRALERERWLRRPVVQAKLWVQGAVAGMPRFPDDRDVNAELDREIRAAPAPGTGPTADAEPARVGG